MSAACPLEDELIALLDGEATENRAADLRAHVQRCTSCRDAWTELTRLRGDIAAPVSGVAAKPSFARILARIEAEPTDRVPPRRPHRYVLAGVAAVAMAAALIVIVPKLAIDRTPGAVAARGGPSASTMDRNVGVTVRRFDGGLAPLVDGESVSADTAYAVSYRNLGAGASAFVMVFAVDASGAVHWIHPAYLDTRHDPSSVPLEHTTEDRVLSTAALLEDPARGPLRVVKLVTARPLLVSQIEALHGIDAASLRMRFPEARVSEITVQLR